MKIHFGHRRVNPLKIFPVRNSFQSFLGKGFWVGLILMATGLVGFLAAREGTRSSMVAFAALATVSTILSFYMMITSIIPVRYQAKTYDNGRERWQTNELVLNSLLIAAGALGTIVGMIASIVGCAYASCCVDQRVSSFYPADASAAMPQTPTPMKYPTGNLPRMAYTHQQPTYRMPM